MTPAKLLAVEEEREKYLARITFPIDKLAWIYTNSKRDMGETDEHGRVTRPPSDPIDIEEFRTYGRKLKTLAAKDWDYALLGAKADREAFSAWAGNTMGQVFVPHKET